MKKSHHNFLKIILYPVTFFLKCIIYIRHLLYDINFLSSQHFQKTKVIAIGNLSLGGTGKTPMTAFLGIELSRQFKIAILSRGYGRKSKGFYWVEENSVFLKVGDEPLLLKKNLGDIPVAVCEKRIDGVKHILEKFPETQVIILDDALQHRALVPDVSILLTTWNRPFASDYLWPLGTLRDVHTRAKYADAIVITKTPQSATVAEKEKISYLIKKYSDAPIFFSHTENYFSPQLPYDQKRVVLVTTIANPTYILDYALRSNLKIAEKFFFSDHYPIAMDEWKTIFETCVRLNAVCVMTEKEYVKLPVEWRKVYASLIYVMKLSMHIENKNDFLNLIIKKISYEKKL